MQANARPGGRHAGTRMALLLTAAGLLAGCVNVHVHFPPAPDVPAPAGKAGKPGSGPANTDGYAP